MIRKRNVSVPVSKFLPIVSYIFYFRGHTGTGTNVKKIGIGTSVYHICYGSNLGSGTLKVLGDKFDMKQA